MQHRQLTLRPGRMHQLPNSEQPEGRVITMSLPVPAFQLGVYRTGDLRALLEDEDKINHFIRCSEKFQWLQMAAENLLVSNQRLAKVSLSQKAKFRDAKLLLAMKYRELGKRRSIIQAKQEQLAEKYSVHYAQKCLRKKINCAEEQCELLFKRLAERRIQVADFLDSFLTLRKLHHIRLIVVKKLKEMIGHREKTRQRLREIHREALDFSLAFPHRPCHAVCSLTTAVVFPPCCHPLFLPLGDHGNPVWCLPQLPLCFDSDDESVCPAACGRGPKRRTVPVRLQPLKVKQKRHPQAPQ